MSWRKVLRCCVAAFTLAWCTAGTASAAEDAGLVNQLAGSVQVRSIASNLEAARKHYASLAGSSEPGDITPELYLFTVLEGARQYDEMDALLERMKTKQPDHPRVAELGRWLAAQRK